MSRDLASPPDSLQDGMPALSVDGISRLLASLTGLAAVVIGLWLAIRLFSAIAHGVQSPEDYKQTFEQWTAILGGDQLKLKLGEQQIAIGPALAVGAVGIGLSLLVWLTLGIMITGAKIISWSSGDREAVKRLLQHALGSHSRRT